MTKSICFVLVPGPQAEWEGVPYRQFAEALLLQQIWPQGSACYRLTYDPETADIVLILEPNYFKTRAYLHELAALEELRRFPQKCFTINQDDNPVALLPGVYAGMPASRYEAGMVIPFCYLVSSPNEYVSVTTCREVPSDLLFSFRGAPSARVRQRLFDVAPGLIKDGRATIALVNRWFNHTTEEKREYVNEILRSKFVLCPRGQGMATHRLFEVMQLGRIPVVLADDWLAPIGPDWNSCSIRIREKEVHNIPSILEANQGRFESMALAARREWEAWFAPGRRLVRMLAKIEQLQKERSTGECDFPLRWSDRRIWRRESSWLRWAWNGVRRRLQAVGSENRPFQIRRQFW